MSNTTHTLSAKTLGCVRQDRLLFENVSFEVQNSQLLVIEGSNGAGKSSLLRLLASIATPYSGHIYWNNQNINDDTANYRKQIHYLAHENGLKQGLSVFENLNLLQVLYETTEVDIDFIVLKMQLQSQRNTLAKQLSAGQKRKLALARLLLIEKPLWILDEPLTALDKDAQEIFFTLLNQHLEKGGMCIMTSHQALSSTIKNIKRIRLSAC